MPLPSLPRSARSAAVLLLAGLLLAGLTGAGPVAAAGDGPVMAARALLQGHVRTGSWFAIAVDLENAGPTVTGELRVTGGADARTRFGTPVELATGSRKRYLLYAQPPTFGGNLKVQLVSGDRVLSEAQVAVALHDQFQLVVGVVSENPARIVSELKLLPGQSGAAPAIVPLQPEDLPERVQAWSGLDRLVWQDVDAAALTPDQLEALGGWVAGGGRLVIIGGSAGADSLSAFPDGLLPYRPAGTLDIDPTVLRSILGGLPEGSRPLTAYAGEPGPGRTLATSGDRVIAAERTLGLGSVTLLGFDPTTPWIAGGESWDVPLWRRLLPPRAGGTANLMDDSQIVSAVTNLPSLALPPIGGLLVLLFGYILLVGPVNYLVLRWLDRREWAWVTVPALIVVFTVGAFGIGGLLRGSDVIVHEVAVVRGAPLTGQATTQSYLGIFSPTRATFQVRVPGDSLLSPPMSGDMFGVGSGSALDILQGDPSRIRDLAVGFGSLRTIRAEASVAGPSIEGSFTLQDGRLVGSITNRSDRALEDAAVVVGSSAVRLRDVDPGETVQVNLAVAGNPFNQPSLSDRVLGPFNWDGSRMDEDDQRRLVRRAVIDQLSIDPMTGFANALPTDSAIFLAWGSDAVVPIEIEGERVRRVANVLYQVPFRYDIRGKTTFRYDLLRSSVVEVNANFFSRDPWAMNMGAGDVRVAFRPITFEGTFRPDAVTFALTFGGDLTMPGGEPVEPVEERRCDPTAEGCLGAQDGLPDIEVLDVRTGEWVQFQHLKPSRPYRLPDVARWLDPDSGELQVRFVNERQEQTSFQFPVAIQGTVR